MARVNTGSTYRVALDTDHNYIYVDAENKNDLLEFLVANYMGEHTIRGVKHLSPDDILCPETEEVMKQSMQPEIKVDLQMRVQAVAKPKINRELKKKYTITMRPSLQQAAQRKAYEEGISLSEIVCLFLEAYVRDS